VRHEPWLLRRAEVLHLDDTLIAAAGVATLGSQRPVAFASRLLAVDGFALGNA